MWNPKFNTIKEDNAFLGEINLNNNNERVELSRICENQHILKAFPIAFLLPLLLLL